MRSIHVRYRTSPRSQAELGFAIDLARRLSGRLFVWTGTDSAAETLLKAVGLPDASSREHAHVSDRVRLRIAQLKAELTPAFCKGDPSQAVHDPSAIVVGGQDVKERSVAATVAVKGEPSVGSRGGGEICLPFANGESARHAARFAIPLAKALGIDLLFYHTTWRDTDLPSEAPPERHMSAEAFEVFGLLCKWADDAGVRHRTIVETATAIAEGTVRAALNEHCALIVLSRGRHVGRGSYVDQVLDRSVIPVMVAGRSKA